MALLPVLHPALPPALLWVHPLAQVDHPPDLMEATVRDLATVTPDTTVPHQLALALLPVTPRVRTVQDRVQALVRVLTVNRRTPRILDRLRRLDMLPRRMVGMDDLLRGPRVDTLRSRMDRDRRLRRGIKGQHGRLDVTLVM